MRQKIHESTLDGLAEQGKVDAKHKLNLRKVSEPIMVNLNSSFIKYNACKGSKRTRIITSPTSTFRSPKNYQKCFLKFHILNT